jgi:hypothetical protein
MLYENKRGVLKKFMRGKFDGPVIDRIDYLTAVKR